VVASHVEELKAQTRSLALARLIDVITSQRPKASGSTAAA
jgi:hypothetical protein